MTGKVFLIGAGPGDEGLITVKGQQQLQVADVVIYDYLANPRLLKHCKKDCEKIYVGKKAGNHTLSQEEISQLILEKAKTGKNVARLKGGDPYIFGRGGEEGEILYENGVDFEVIPGISSAIGGLAYAGIPVTFREIATSFHVITGHLSKEDKNINYKALAGLDGTLVFLMGIGNIENITQSLMEQGKSPSTPAAIVYQASTPKQQVVVGLLENIAKMKHTGVEKPGIIVIGEVVKKRDVLDFHSRKPLFGQKIIVTRATTQNSSLVEQIKDLGGEAIELPTIEIQILNQDILKHQFAILSKFTHLVLTSQNSVDIFFQTLFEAGYDARHLAQLKITAVGAVTKKALEKYFVKADFMAQTYDSKSLVTLLEQQLKPEDHVLFPRSKKANNELIEALSQFCPVDVVTIYDTLPAPISKEQMEEALKDANAVLFTSASTVECFMEPLKQMAISVPASLKLVTIGPMTTEKLKAYGFADYIEAGSHTTAGMIETMLSKQL
ncbi:MAG: uroporphyrinogen-III C-methyltransferase [Vallitaleaceae bacterium]|nr:uroporphyrinogen-III C-methyltransferase [Vallitaleaceae bacterium]